MSTMRSRLNLAATFAGCAVMIAVGMLVLLDALQAQAAEGEADAEVNTAQIVVQFDESDALVREITFSDDITGFAALELAGLDVEYTTEYGAPAVCSIEGVGCPASDCFCDPDRSWGYWYWDDGDWVSHGSGAGTTLITQTDSIEGWQWGRWMEVPKPSPAPEALAALGALEWLQSRQSAENGSYGDKVSPSLDVMLAIGANHQLAEEWRVDAEEPSLNDFVAVAGKRYSEEGVAESGRMAAAVTAAEGCWSPDAAEPTSYYSPTLGSLSDQAGFLSWGILGTIALSESVPVDSVNYLRGLALSSGGWEWSPTWGADTNTTALAIQALLASGVPTATAEIADGLVYLKAAQNDDGGFPYQPDSPYGTDSDSNSTAWVVQAILAASENPRSTAWSSSGVSPIDYLLGMQLQDGSFEYQKNLGSDEFATRQVVVSLLGSHLPIQIWQPADCVLSKSYLPSLLGE